MRAIDSDTLRWKPRARGDQALHSSEEERLAQTREEARSQWLQGRWKVERTFAWLFNFRRFIVRWEHDYHIFLAFLIIACIIILLGAVSG